MADEIRLWRIDDRERLVEYERVALDLESRIESWLEQNISILAPDLLVIGQQVGTDFGGIIDLLCMDAAGDLVVVELKRHRTPREITAQVLDYASWVADLPSDRIAEIADAYLKHNGPLADAFRRRFQTDLPESLNSGHRMVIVASEIDSSSERIVRYLSDAYGVNINAATFHYFRSSGGEEFLARNFLIEPERVEYQTRANSASKRLPNLTFDELEEIARRNEVGVVYSEIVAGLTPWFQRHTTRSSISFTVAIDDGRRSFFNLVPKESDKVRGLRYQIYPRRISVALGLSERDVQDLLPAGRTEWQYPGSSDPDFAGFQGFFCTSAEVQNFLRGVQRARR